MDEAAHIILSTIIEHLRGGETTLDKVIMCLYDQRAYRVFETELQQLT